MYAHQPVILLLSALLLIFPPDSEARQPAAGLQDPASFEEFLDFLENLKNNKLSFTQEDFDYLSGRFASFLTETEKDLRYLTIEHILKTRNDHWLIISNHFFMTGNSSVLKIFSPDGLLTGHMELFRDADTGGEGNYICGNYTILNNYLIRYSSKEELYINDKWDSIYSEVIITITPEGLFSLSPILVRTPEQNNTVSFSVTNPDPSDGSCNQDYDRPFASMSIAELRIARNLVFARYRYRFKSADLQEHFSQCGWYEADDSFSPEYLSELDKIVIDHLLMLEKSSSQ